MEVSTTTVANTSPTAASTGSDLNGAAVLVRIGIGTFLYSCSSLLALAYYSIEVYPSKTSSTSMLSTRDPCFKLN